MSMHVQKLTFAIQGEAASVEIKGKTAWVFIAHKKITLSIDQTEKEKALSEIEDYLNDNKEKIVNLIQQHNILEKAFSSNKKIILLDGGRFHYSKKNSTTKNTTIEQECDLLEQKIRDHQESPKRVQWEVKLELLKQAIHEMEAFKHLKPEAKESSLSKFKDKGKKYPNSSESNGLENFTYSYKPLPIEDIDHVAESPLKIIPEKHLRVVRKRTHKKMKDKIDTLGIPRDRYFFEKTFKKVRFYSLPPSFKSEKSKTQLMSRFEVLQVPISMDFDHEWGHLYYNKDDHSRWVQSATPKARKERMADWIPGPNKEKLTPTHKLNAQKPSFKKHQSPQKTFFCHYTPALNIVGKAGHHDDYADYFSSSGQFDEDKYLEDMGLIFHHALLAQLASGVEHIVWHPFGMEADLRHLSKRDRRYEDPQEMTDLKYKIAYKFREQFEREEFNNLQLHLCLSTGREPNLKETLRKEAVDNHNAFVSVFSNAPSKVKTRVSLHQNADRPVLAQDLAERYGKNKVSMINATNTELLGDNWSTKPTQDNIHCRSVAAASVACLLDAGLRVKARISDELALRIEEYGGKVIEFEEE